MKSKPAFRERWEAASRFLKITLSYETMSADKLLTIKEASEWATAHLGKNVTTSNIAYLIQYGRIEKRADNGSTQPKRKSSLTRY
ncbi:MAG: hypothetical protein LBT46_11145 [Planctomycetaceae bacterium]|jgi:hypothetical protein|nr:hypothetical protein [Planctomycetaceae bacterium]